MTNEPLQPDTVLAYWTAIRTKACAACLDVAAVDEGPERRVVVKLKVPESITLEQEDLRGDLADAARGGGPVGDAAQAVARVLHQHLMREARFAMPALSLLRPLSEGQWTPDMAEAIALTDALKRELPRMLEEHKSIVSALKVLAAVAGRENRTEYAWLAQKLIQHARTEEEVLYPAALLVGEYLRLRQSAASS